jgi:prepilin-type N-terminal cleavage/methylation domain-containing protein
MGNRKPSAGFTLVEMMIVIVIIGILMAVAIPAINRAVIAGRQTAIRMEINSLSQAVEQYMQKYGDYPPDGSNRDVMERHMRRLFPRISPKDLALLTQLTSIRGTTTHSFVAMDRAEALVFFLGGFSDNQLNPLTGEGGPLALIPGRTVGSTDIGDYQYNGTRDNAFFEFDPTRLTVARANDNAPLLSVDEAVWASDATKFDAAGGQDPLPVYLAGGAERTPLVYFDSRTYGPVGGGEFNGYLHPQFGGIRPYKTGIDIKPPTGSTYSSVDAAFAAVPFHNPKTFQIISPGLDGIFGSLTDAPGGLPVHFITETGTPVYPNAGASSAAGLIFTGGSAGRRFQDLGFFSGISVNGHLDNITNFSTAALGDDLQ